MVERCYWHLPGGAWACTMMADACVRDVGKNGRIRSLRRSSEWFSTSKRKNSGAEAPLATIEAC